MGRSMSNATQPLISAMRVEKLFGLYTYSLPRDGSFQNAAILYGDNGVGKSTILRMAFHLLSAANDRGHRTALFKIDFHSFDVELVSGVTIKAARIHKSELDFLQLTILRGNEILARWDYRPGSRSVARMSEGDQYVIF
jgi:predicted ATPase